MGSVAAQALARNIYMRAAAGNGIYTAIKSVWAHPHPANPTYATVSTAENTQHYFGTQILKIRI